MNRTLLGICLLLSTGSLGMSIWTYCTQANRSEDKPGPDADGEMTARLESLQERVRQLEETSAERSSVALLLLVDVSTSMGEQNFDWNGKPMSRLDAVKRALKLFVQGAGAVREAGPDAPAFEGRPRDLIGLVVFASRPETTCPLTLDHSALVERLNAERVRTDPGEGQTNLSDAIMIGLAQLDAAGARRKVLVLLTDGEHNVEQTATGLSPGQTAYVASSLKVPIHLIDVSGGHGRTPDQPTPALRVIATKTGGRYFKAHDRASLLSACRDIDRRERHLTEKRVKK